MQKRLKYNIAKIFNQLGYDEQTSYLYLNIANGLKTVKGDLNNPIGEQIYHTGDIAKYDENWGIVYPSPYWIPAPFICDIVIWLEKTFNIKIIINYIENSGLTYDIILPNNFKELNFENDLLYNSYKSLQDIYDNNTIKKQYFTSIELTYENAVNKIAICADKNNWLSKIYKYI